MRLRRRLLWLLPALAVLLPAGWALRWSWADIQYWQAKVRIERWADGTPVTEPEWHRAEAALQRAITLNPGNGEYLSTMARLWKWRHPDAAWDTIPAALAHLRAIEWHRKAIAARPAWPYEHALLAEVLRRVGRFDAEFDDAIRMADELGAWEPGVQYLMADLLVNNADGLTEAQRERLLAAVGRAVRHVYTAHRDRVVRVLRNSPWLDAACRLPEVRAAEGRHPYCKRLEASDAAA